MNSAVTWKAVFIIGAIILSMVGCSALIEFSGVCFNFDHC